MNTLSQIARFVAWFMLLGMSLPCDAQDPRNAEVAEPPELEWIRPSSDGTHFVLEQSGRPFVAWGVNYDHDGEGRLLEDYWACEWETIVEDFSEIKALGANVVRIHLQLGKFMRKPDKANRKNLCRLGRLVRLAEDNGLYLDVTGLGCYHKQDTPRWYEKLDEGARWDVQARFWMEIAEVCKSSPAIFCYDLMNEPILPGKNKVESEWLTGELGGKFFVQRISLDLAGRTRKEVAKRWVAKLSSAIRDVDSRHMITVGVIPWALVFEGAQPLFHDPDVGEPLDFVAVHFYPRKNKVDEALAALKVYEVGKPLVVEETFPLRCGIDELEDFIARSRAIADGWISFYWGETIEENQRKGDLKGSIMARWLRRFRALAPQAGESARSECSESMRPKGPKQRE
ncbi:MAG: cellulase family glycosylhydrolase [Planctomycetota bacterium]